ncbi:MAG TPA: hypothetical protein VK995_04315, partial [Oceanipulchritudo sp.]|nr:hypothetical protein [Oceanipulchritudo sp.]
MKPFRIPAEDRVTFYSGVLPPARALVIADRIRQTKAPVAIILCSRQIEARELIATVPQFGRLAGKEDRPIAYDLLPVPPPPEDPDDPMPERLREELECDRLTTLTHLANHARSPETNERLAIFTTPDGLFAPVPELGELTSRELTLSVGHQINFEKLKERLA